MGPDETGQLYYSLPTSCCNSCKVKLSLKVTWIRPREGLPSGNKELNDATVLLSSTHLKENPVHSNESTGGACV